MAPISEKLLHWYDANARSLPWRFEPTPYKTWVSEIMLQQTRVETVIPYFERFIARFPEIGILAASEESDVLRLWEGLGYYSRARNLHKAARVMLEDYAGQIPADIAALRSLPGVGAYTAGAIASIAFGAAEPALDANIRRVGARLLDLHEPPGSEVDRILWEFCRRILPAQRSGDFNQALMDLASKVCTPKAPTCHLCPLWSDCLAFQRDTAAQLPVRKPKAKIPHKLVLAAVITRGNEVLLAQRPADGMLGKLWEYPGGSVPEETPSLPGALRELMLSRFGFRIDVGSPLGSYKHAYTHFRITLHTFRCELPGASHLPLPPGFAWAPIGELSTFPMGKVARQISLNLAEKTPPC